MKNLFLLAVLALLISCTKSEGLKTGFVSAGNLKIYFERQGQGTSVLLLHAGLQDHRMWDEQVKMLQGNHDVLVVDLPGQGKSSGFDTTQLAADVIIRVLDSLQVEKTAVVGLSYGSSVATDLVLAYPDRVEKVVLVSSGVTGWDKVVRPDSVSQRYFTLLDSAFSKKDLEKTASVFTQAWCDGPFRKPEQVKKEVRDYISNTTLENLKKHSADSWAKFNPVTAAERVTQIKKPVLILYGNKDIPMIKDVSIFLNRSIPGSSLVEIPDAAHMLNMEVPHVFNKHLSRFLD
jgi:3-oxoadipate enol-lactonase